MTSERSQLPRAMRLTGWALLLVTLLYPWDVWRTWYTVRDLIVSEEAPTSPGPSGIAFNVKTSTIHCGIVSWFGGVGTALSLGWLLVAVVAWVGRTIRREAPLATPSRMVLAGVAGGVALALGTHQYFERVHGILFM